MSNNNTDYYKLPQLREVALYSFVSLVQIVVHGARFEKVRKKQHREHMIIIDIFFICHCWLENKTAHKLIRCLKSSYWIIILNNDIYI